MDLTAVFGAVLHSAWLLPVLAVLIALDGPFPVLPSETLLMSAAALAFGEDNAPMLVGLFLAALLGSAAGDLAVFGLGRSSHRLLVRTSYEEGGLGGWVRHHLLRRPGVALVGARFVPAGRLVSTAAAGRFGLPLRRFVPWSLASSAAWSLYMLLVGLALGPFTGGDPLLALAAGVGMAAVTAGMFAVFSRVRARLRSRAAVVPPDPETALFQS